MPSCEGTSENKQTQKWSENGWEDEQTLHTLTELHIVHRAYNAGVLTLYLIFNAVDMPATLTNPIIMKANRIFSQGWTSNSGGAACTVVLVGAGVAAPIPRRKNSITATCTGIEKALQFSMLKVERRRLCSLRVIGFDRRAPWFLVPARS